jgi:GDP-L-fucose synthase
MKQNSKICIFGSGGLLGSAIVKILKEKGYENILTPRSSEVNLLKKTDVDNYLEREKPEFIFMVAGLVGGIMGNKKRQADFLYQNTLMILNLLESIKNECPKSKLLFTGSTCIYPKENPQPIEEARLLAGKLEETNKGYALAKITGIIACQLYREQYNLNTICAMPTNLYGLNDTYDLENGHMIPSLIKKILIAKDKKLESITLWGSGNPRREALYSEDCADALIYLMNNYSSDEIVNIGTGFDYSIKEFAEIISNEIEWKGKIVYDSAKPDGTFEKKTNITQLKKIYPKFSPMPLSEGIKEILKDKEESKRILK